MWKVGSRRSRLAIKQVEEFIKYFPGQRFEVFYFDTTGDIDKTTPISNIEGSNFFTDAIDKALLEEKIDLAVHSAKDLPDKLPSGITVAFMTESIYPYDVLVSKIVPSPLPLSPSGRGVGVRGRGKGEGELPFGAKVGTSSKRRKEQLRNYRPDLQILDIRGNIEERLEKLDRGEYDAIVVAGAGLIRLGLENRITQVLPFHPHPLQGRLAITVRKDDYEKGLFSWCRTR